jgi:hypothetical protein
MQSADEHLWSKLEGGYRMPLDPRPLIQELESGDDTEAMWEELWEELHHQGDVGDASYAAVPLLVDLYRKQGVIEWNTYAIVATIDLARTNGRNPDLPEWIKSNYLSAIQSLAETGAKEVLLAEDADAVRAMLGVIAIAKDLRTHAKFLVEYTDDELEEMDPQN